MLKFCHLYSGSSGNSLYLSLNGKGVLIDAGLSGKATLNALENIDVDPKCIQALLITHDHSDHTKGAGILSRKLDIPIYATEGTWSVLSKYVGKVSEKNVKVIDDMHDFLIGDINVSAFSIPHDAMEPVAFNLYADNKKITIATDIGHMDKKLLAKMEDSDLLFLESNHDINMVKVGKYPYNLKRRILGKRGHLSNEMAAKVVAYFANKGMNKFILGHLSQENNYPILAYETTNAKLLEKKIKVGKDVTLSVALRDQVGPIINI